MTDDDLDQAYTALSEALGRTAPERTALLLATLSLALMARDPDRDRVLAAIAQAERLARD